jgi:hypothetical protein
MLALTRAGSGSSSFVKGRTHKFRRPVPASGRNRSGFKRPAAKIEKQQSAHLENVVHFYLHGMTPAGPLL